MYGTTMKSFNMNKDSRISAHRINKSQEKIKKKTSKKENEKFQDKKYINISAETREEKTVVNESLNPFEGFSIKDLPIASVVITVILTMMMLVMMSGFGGI